MKRVLYTMLLILALTQSSHAVAGVIRQVVSFQNLDAVATCTSGGSCLQTWSGQGQSGPPVSYFFLDFLAAAANAGLSGVALDGVTWHLQGVLRVDFVFSIPVGYSIAGSGFGAFPLFGILIPGGQDIGDRSLSTYATMNCMGGATCQANAELPFDITINVSDFSQYLVPNVFGDLLAAEATPLFDFEELALVPGYTGTVHTTFTGGLNSLSLEYRFVPEPPTLALLSLALVGLVSLRRQRRCQSSP